MKVIQIKVMHRTIVYVHEYVQNQASWYGIETFSVITVEKPPQQSRPILMQGSESKRGWYRYICVSHETNNMKTQKRLCSDCYFYKVFVALQ